MRNRLLDRMRRSIASELLNDWNSSPERDTADIEKRGKKRKHLLRKLPTHLFEQQRWQELWNIANSRFFDEKLLVLKHTERLESDFDLLFQELRRVSYIEKMLDTTCC